ncbi:MAG: HAMP domain-containing protein [Anaerolineae bacterium]|nr:HAMP domain-containing protein [Anaerolineae bacterium]
MFKSLRFRLIASYLLVVLLAMGVAAGLAWAALDRAFLDVLRENLLAQAQRVAQAVEAGSDNLGTSYVVSYAIDGVQVSPEPYLQAVNAMPGYHTRIIDEEGLAVLGSSGVGETHQPEIAYEYRPELNQGISVRGASGVIAAPPSVDLLDREEVQSALAGEPATAVRTYAWAPDRRVLYAAYPIHAPDGSISTIVYIASPIPRFSLSLLPTYFASQVVGGALLAVFLAGLAGFLLARSLTRPLRRLTDAASALARGERVPAIAASSTDELHLLGEAFNTMNANLTVARDVLAAQARQREAILHGLADAVLATDGSGEIILTNEAASALLDIASQPVLEVIHRTLAGGEPQAAEVSAQARVFELLTTPLRGEDGSVSGAVAVGHDVTAYRQLDRLRTNFVSDVSHELRTPLTAIKGFIETLQDGAADDPAVRDRFLNTIAAETERLTRLTNDLLLLTRADAGRLDLHLASIDLVGCAQRAVAQLAGRAREKQVAIATELPDSPALAQADADRIHQVLVNLLDNAIKFTPAGGGVVVCVSSSGSGDKEARGQDGGITPLSPCLLVSVRDTGPGIPADEIPHVFERFYRGDRSRAREGADGSGLGLAIAKAIVEAHGGQIWVTSEPGKGAAFRFTLSLV